MDKPKVAYCQKCKKYFKTDQGLKVHQKLKPNCDTKLTCDKCSKTFDREFNYNRHIASETDCVDEPKQNKESCEYCLRTFTRKSNLQRHYKTCMVKTSPQWTSIVVDRLENEEPSQKEESVEDMVKALMNKVEQLETINIEMKNKIEVNINTNVHIGKDRIIGINEFTDSIMKNPENIQRILGHMDSSKKNAIYDIRDHFLFNVDQHPENIFYFLTNIRHCKTLMKDNGEWKLFSFNIAYMKIFSVVLECIALGMGRAGLTEERLKHYKTIYNLIVEEAHDICSHDSKNRDRNYIELRDKMIKVKKDMAEKAPQLYIELQDEYSEQKRLIVSKKN